MPKRQDPRGANRSLRDALRDNRWFTAGRGGQWQRTARIVGWWRRRRGSGKR